MSELARFMSGVVGLMLTGIFGDGYPERLDVLFVMSPYPCRLCDLAVWLGLAQAAIKRTLSAAGNEDVDRVDFSLGAID